MSLPTLRDPPPPGAIAKLLLNVHFEVFPRAGLRGLHIFTFQEIAATERWRQATFAGCAGRTYDVSPPQDPVGPQPSHEPDA